MLLKIWIRNQGESCEEADTNAADILGMKPRTVKAIRLGQMNPSPKIAKEISDKIKYVSFRDCFDV